ncbi:lymphocyte antigen 6 complex locus protein G6d [Ornithorhynchus anatinus]|uniref:lymphocyte antigen 6 complex locus protein G6d n=1 Tax=Ornithorhynchus anatinus TaxID=9258 RepID=UPI00045411BF|nr:lymphocyte antigen 6 complex locus protein G6d [Ornithorhynchus anatinus]
MCAEGERCGLVDRWSPDHSQDPVSFPRHYQHSTVTLTHHRPACVAAQHCDREETELVAGVVYTTYSTCCYGHLCNGSTTAAPSAILAGALALAWVFKGLWEG